MVQKNRGIKMIRNKITKTIIAILIAMPLTTRLAFAHSGRTDSSGGHKDNKNVSGLGSYHYHCGGIQLIYMIMGYVLIRIQVYHQMEVQVQHQKKQLLQQKRRKRVI